MDPQALYREGRLTEAIASLNAELRDHPSDVRRRTFLFELLCFAGDYERASKQLDVLAKADPDAMPSIMSYQGVLGCEEARRDMFAAGSFPEGDGDPAPVRGRLNGQAFAHLTDGDPRVGARLEVYLGGSYSWIPMEHVGKLTMEAPHRLRDLIWASASLTGGDDLAGSDFGDVLIPVLTPLAHRNSDDLVRLGRVTDWEDLPDGSQAPVGQRMLLVDDEEFPILEVRELEIDGRSTDVG